MLQEETFVLLYLGRISLGPDLGGSEVSEWCQNQDFYIASRTCVLTKYHASLCLSQAVSAFLKVPEPPRLVIERSLDGMFREWLVAILD